MIRSSSSSERTPLVQPTYVYESSLSRRYKERLRTFQCCICAAILCVLSLLSVLAITLLVSVSYSLDAELHGNITNATEEDITDTTQRSTTTTTTPTAIAENITATNNLSLVFLPPHLQPLLRQSWPLPGVEAGPWVGPVNPSPEVLNAAISRGEAALGAMRARELEAPRLTRGSPAAKAQRASATGSDIKPLSDSAFAAEYATRALTDGVTWVEWRGGVGRGPRTNGTWPEPPYCRDGVGPPCEPSRFRRADGTCNNLNHPRRWGVAFTPLRRVIPPTYADGVGAPRSGLGGAPLPGARVVSLSVHRPGYVRDATFTVMLAVWGQFLDHDITATALSKGTNGSSISCCALLESEAARLHPECFPVLLDPEDPFYQEYNVTCMEFIRSAPAPTCYFGPRQQLNQATAFIDGSTIYGSKEAKIQKLKSGTGGLLRMMEVGGRELLPQSVDPDDACNTAEMNAKGRYCFESGDDRANENLHLTTMHLVWARQHNRVARALATLNPAWQDRRLFAEARRIVGAQMQHITYTEFLPIILGGDIMRSLNLGVLERGYSDVYNASVDPSIANHFSAAAFRFAHTLLPGVIHSRSAQNGTQEYVHLHEILFNPYSLYDVTGANDAIKSALYTKVHGVDPHVTDELTNHMFERNRTSKDHGPCGLDLVSLNIQRGRDHGLPPYPAWRRHCGFPQPTSFQELRDVFDNQSYARVAAIYRRVDDIDLYTGALSEEPHGRLLGPTLTCLIADQFLRLKVGDRYWYETQEKPMAFTPEQLQEIRKTTLAGIFCANEMRLSEVQRKVMEEQDDANPVVPCSDIEQPDLTPWRDSDDS